MPDCHPVVKHYTGFDLSEESLVHSWYIADLWSKMTSYQPGEKLVSDEFHVGDTAFRLELYPNGNNWQPGNTEVLVLCVLWNKGWVKNAHFAKHCGCFGGRS